MSLPCLVVARNSTAAQLTAPAAAVAAQSTSFDRAASAAILATLSSPAFSFAAHCALKVFKVCNLPMSLSSGAANGNEWLNMTEHYGIYVNQGLLAVAAQQQCDGGRPE